MSKHNKIGFNPLDTNDILSDTFFKLSDKKEKSDPLKPIHYKIVSISMYTHDIKHLDNLVKSLKKRGHTKISKSQIIRYALHSMDLNKITKEL